MSCKSALYSANTASQSISVGGIINFGQIVRRYGGNIGMSGGNVTITGSGYYDVDANITFEASAVGTATIALYKDGIAISGASATFTTTADTTYQVAIPALIREVCNCQSTITAIVTGVAGTVANSAIVVEKI